MKNTLEKNKEILVAFGEMLDKDLGALGTGYIKETATKFLKAQEEKNKEVDLYYKKEYLNCLAEDIFSNAKNKGFHDNPREVGTMLMLIVSELSEALEADRVDKEIFDMPTRIEDCYVLLEKAKEDESFNDSFKMCFAGRVKDSFEDEIADALIRILDLCGSRGIDISSHVNLKMYYNSLREHKHGKNY